MACRDCIHYRFEDMRGEGDEPWCLLQRGPTDPGFEGCTDEEEGEF